MNRTELAKKAAEILSKNPSAIVHHLPTYVLRNIVIIDDFSERKTNYNTFVSRCSRTFDICESSVKKILRRKIK